MDERNTEEVNRLNDILDYLYWRGDLSFDQDPLNEIDAIIFSEFAYIDFSRLAPVKLIEGELTIKEASKLWDEANREDFMPTGYLHHEKAYEALTLAGDSKRFENILISKHVKDISANEESQFGVTTFQREGEPFFIAFEGTDLRSLGWKEDLQMTYLPTIPSQRKAVDFLSDHFEKHPQRVSIGGHSKGGNLAVFAAIYVDEEYQPLINHVYSYDGPGFTKEILEDENYLRLENRIHSFIPQDSMIGLLLHKLEEPEVIYSGASDSSQHDAYTWEIKGNHFVPSELTTSAHDIQQIMNELLDELSLKDRENFSETLFTILGDGEDDFILGDRKYNLQKIPEMIKEFRDLDQEEKKSLFKVLRIFYRKRIEATFEN